MRQLTKIIPCSNFALNIVVMILVLVCKFLAFLCCPVPAVNHTLPIKCISEIKSATITRLSVSPNSGHYRKGQKNPQKNPTNRCNKD